MNPSLSLPLPFPSILDLVRDFLQWTIAHATTYRNALADLIADAVDAGTTDASGDIAIYTASFATLLCTINFAAPPAFGSAAAGVASAASLPRTGTAVADGTAAVFRMRNRDNTEILNGSVGTSGQDMNLSSTGIATNDEISLNTINYTAAP